MIEIYNAIFNPEKSAVALRYLRIIRFLVILCLTWLFYVFYKFGYIQHLKKIVANSKLF